jgi:hypothetical protein
MNIAKGDKDSFFVVKNINLNKLSFFFNLFYEVIIKTD